MRSLSRRKLLSGVGLTGIAALAGVTLPKYTKKIMAKNIEEMQDEFAMLCNIELRRTKLGSDQLVIKNADFRNSISGISCENTKFVDCYFYPGIILQVTLLNNVSFESCQFMECSIGNGIWNNVHFLKCDGRKMFRVIGGKGSKNVTFQECDFMGSSPVAGDTHENYFGGVGTHGESTFDNCDLKYVEILGASKLHVKRSRLNKVEVINYQAVGNANFLDSNIQDYLKITGEFKSFTMNSVNFEFFSIEKFQSENFVMEGCSGVFYARQSKINEVLIKNCTFTKKSGASAEEKLYSGFHVRFPKIKNILMENVKFEAGGSLHIGGGENYTYKQGFPERGEKFVYSKFEKISFLKTILINSSLRYIDAQEIRLDSCEIKDFDLSDDRIGGLQILGSSLAGKIDFARTTINELLDEKNNKVPGLQMNTPQPVADRIS